MAVATYSRSASRVTSVRHLLLVSGAVVAVRCIHHRRDVIPQPIIMITVRLCSRAPGPRARRAMRLGLAGRNGGSAVAPCYVTGPTPANSAARRSRNTDRRVAPTGQLRPADLSPGCPAPGRLAGLAVELSRSAPRAIPAEGHHRNRRQIGHCPAVPLRDAKNVVGGIRSSWGRSCSPPSAPLSAPPGVMASTPISDLRYATGRATSRSVERGSS